MFPYFAKNGKNFYPVEIDKSRVHPKSVVLDPVFYNLNRNKLTGRFKPPPNACRSAFNRVKFQDLFLPRQVEDAKEYIQRIADSHVGILIPNADHRWQEQIHQWHTEGKLVYYTNEYQSSTIFLVQTW